MPAPAPSTPADAVVTVPSHPHLGADEIARFHDQGYLGPYTLCAPDEMAVIRARIERMIASEDGPSPHSRLVSRYLDQPVVRSLATHPAIVGRLDGLIGPDVALWASNFFIKQPGSREIPWHQDFNYWAIDPLVNLTAWIAIDEATVANACVQLIPGSHRRILPHVKAGAEMHFQEMADPALVDARGALPMELEPGQFFLFGERLLHRSDAFSSGRRRIGMTCRYTVPFVRIDHDALHPGHRALMVRGQDRHHRNRYV